MARNVKTVSLKYTEDKRVFDFLEAQSNLSDSLVYLIQQEIKENGVRNLQCFVPSKRFIDLIPLITGQCSYKACVSPGEMKSVPGMAPQGATGRRAQYFTFSFYVKKGEDNRLFEFSEIQDNFSDSALFLIQKEIYENGIRDLAEVIPQKRKW